MDREREKPGMEANSSKKNHEKYDMSWLNLEDFFVILKEKLNTLVTFKSWGKG